ncbi:MarR family winged helix-turn-helix transcriptional regulator [Longimicrobium terrae]|uniref:DNA-binding MarR family transcriptional regulator n=1 Tax=Longimicrobium terrae TaxID=1639882 RepID=A0A841H760_9BACT|nr:MarR family transcriptional regulator [Longimicrobium terrae]MBB4638155.1 DNA-binding MarR family transcriptional regulator [Longimicrobium terrae]MBB6073686.1 DNA-binding MarR family transcriptional regulator [Longimicrobium terrae]NNC30363.1 MarR family transcriptional regulator [Longimicrobium terrae]
MPDRPIPPATRLWVSLARTYRHVSRRQARALAEVGLSVPQFDVLATLVRSPECGPRMGELSDRLLVTEGNVTGLVSRLEDAGLARRGPDPADARAVRVQLTDEGRALALRAVPRVEAELDAVFEGVPEVEMRQLQRLMRRARRSEPR